MQGLIRRMVMKRIESRLAAAQKKYDEESIKIEMEAREAHVHIEGKRIAADEALAEAIVDEVLSK
jgi:hypothetical protein